MPRRTPYARQSAVFREVLDGKRKGIFRGLGSREIARRITLAGATFSDSSVRTIRESGGIPREAVLRAIGQAFAEELLDRWGDDIREAFERSPTPDLAAEWLVWVAQTDGDPAKRPRIPEYGLSAPHLEEIVGAVVRELRPLLVGREAS